MNPAQPNPNITHLHCCLMLHRPILQDYVKRRKEWVDELNIMLRMKKKAEIQVCHLIRHVLFAALSVLFSLPPNQTRISIPPTLPSPP